jgi:hypothetical protein
MATLIEIDSKHKTEFNFKFNSLHFRDFVRYVEEQTSDDFLNYMLIKKQFGGFLDSTNNTLIADDLIVSFTSKDTLDKLTTVINFTSEYFVANIHNYTDNDLEEVKQRIVCLTLKLKEYMMYYATNYSDLFKYIRYQNYIKQGHDYIRFEEFEK